MLVIDVGNTRIKWGLWQSNELHSKGAFVYQENQLGQELNENFASLQQQENVYICCVAGDQVMRAIQGWFKQQWGVDVCIIRSQLQFEDVRNGYEDPRQLGADRWVAMVAAYKKYRKAVCVIDCGSAITMDVVNAQGQHLGGLIMPGLEMMRSTLYRGTHGISQSDGRLCVLGLNTADAVHSGCFQLITHGLQGLIAKTSATRGDLVCVITGGDGEELARHMDFSCCHDNDLILYGLNLIAKLKN